MRRAGRVGGVERLGVERHQAPGGTTNIMLNERALVLNRHWLAVDTVSVRRALCMLYLDVARAVAPETFELHDWSSWAALRVEDGQPAVQAVRFQIRVPEIVLLLGATIGSRASRPPSPAGTSSAAIASPASTAAASPERASSRSTTSCRIAWVAGAAG